MTKHLIGERICLREMEGRDWGDVHKYASQRIACQYQAWGPNTEEQSKAFVEQIIADAAKEVRTRFAFAIIENETMIGTGELSMRDQLNKSGEIAYIINPDYWGRGIATEAARLLLGYGFHECHLHRIYATCDPRNIGSAKVLEKIGMTMEGAYAKMYS